MSSLFADGTSPIFHLVGPPEAKLDFGTFFTAARLHPAPLVVIVAGAAAYFWALGRIRRRGERRPAWRTLCFVAGILTVASATLSGLTSFEHDFTVIGVQHALLLYVAPFFLALSAPVTVAVEAAGPARGARIRAAFTGRAARVITVPPIAALAFAALPFCLYFTPLLRIALDHGAVWQLVNLGLLAAGCLFGWAMAGADPIPKLLGHGWRMVWLLLTVPATTILGMALESQRQGLAPGLTAAGTHLGGGLMWTIGGLLALFATICVLVSWCRLEQRSADTRDRRLDPEAAVQLAYWKANRRQAAEEAGLLAHSDVDELAAEVLALQGAAPQLALPAGTPVPAEAADPADAAATDQRP